MPTPYRAPTLDTFEWQSPVTSILNTPPGGPAKGNRYIVGTSPTDAWVGHAKAITYYDGSNWQFDAPSQDYAIIVKSNNYIYYYSGSAWVEYGANIIHTDRSAEISALTEKTSPLVADLLVIEDSASSNVKKKVQIGNQPFVSKDGTVNPTNLLSNSSFETWSTSISAVPDGWAIYDASTGTTTIARESTIVKKGNYSAKLTRVTNNCQLYNTNFNVTSFYTYYKGRTVTFGCWVYATVANRVLLSISDGLTSTYSSYHTGDSTWQWLSVTMTLSASAIALYAGCNVTTGDTSAYFDGAMLVEGASTFAFNPTLTDIVIAKDGTVNSINLISNGNFESWSSGTTVAPDGWTLAGAGATIARESTTIKIGTYSAKVTRSGTDCYLYNTNYNVAPILGKGISYWKSRIITFGCWVYCDTASAAFIRTNDGTGDLSSSYHTGNSTWQLLTVTRTISNSATVFAIYLQINNTNTSAYFDGAMLVEGASTFAFSSSISDVIVPIDGTSNPNNLLINGDFELWSSGTSVAPDNWTLTGSGATIARESTIIKIGTYSSKLTRSGTDCYIFNRNYNVTSFYTYYKGRTVTFGCWVYATVANRARIKLGDGGGGTMVNSSYHTGDSTWQWLTVTKLIGTGAVYVIAECTIDTGDTSAYFDGAILVEGPSTFAFSQSIQDRVFNNRGDPSANDKVLANLTTDGSYHDLDLSAIVPVGASLILLRLQILDDAASSEIRFRKNGNTNSYNEAAIRTQVANVTNVGDLWVACDSNRVVEYITTNTTFTGINIVVGGWSFGI